MKDILFEKIDVYTGEEILKNAYVGISGELIDYVGDAAPIDAAEYKRHIGGNHLVLAPALVNAHSHVPMTLFRGAGENLALMDWLRQEIFPREDKLTPGDIYSGAMLGICEMIKSGTVSFSDMYFMCEDIIKAALECNVKINCSRGTSGSEDNSDDVIYTKELYKNYHDKNNGKIKIDYGIHAEYTSTPGLVELIARAAKEDNAIIHLHLSETKGEHEDCIKKYNMTPSEYFAEHGVFENKTLAAHGVYLTDNDMSILSSKNVSVAHNPVSNLKLGSGIARTCDMLAAGINVALGTDGAASNNTLDMFEEMKSAALIMKGSTLDARQGDCKQIYDFASVNGYKAQGRDGCGRIKKGYHADLICLDFDKEHLTPCYNILYHLIYACRGSDVIMTVCDGKILYENGSVTGIDEEKVKYNARQSAERL